MCKVLNYLKPVVREWYHLGLELEIEDSELQAIELDNRHDVQGCKRKMVQKWMSTPRLKPTWVSLVKALRRINEVSVAARITEEERELNFIVLYLATPQCTYRQGKAKKKHRLVIHYQWSDFVQCTCVLALL